MATALLLVGSTLVWFNNQTKFSTEAGDVAVDVPTLVSEDPLSNLHEDLLKMLNDGDHDTEELSTLFAEKEAVNDEAFL